jgi:hypothetical protein
MTQLPVHDRYCHVETAGFTLAILQMAFGDGACVRFDHECYWPERRFALRINRVLCARSGHRVRWVSRPEPLGTSGRSRNIGVLPGGHAKTDGRDMPPGAAHATGYPNLS